MKRKISILFSFLIVDLFCSKVYADVKENTQDIKSIQKIAKNLRHSLAVTWAERQKAVQRGCETRFDSTFGEAQTLVDNLFVEINHFLETQGSSQVSEEKKNNTKTVSSERLNQNALKIIAQFQVLMEHLQGTLQEAKSVYPEELSLYPYQASNRITTGPSNKGRRVRKSIKLKRLQDKDENHSRPSIRYQISGTQIDMPGPDDESFIH